MELTDDLWQATEPGLSGAEEAIAADLRAIYLIVPDPVTAERHVQAMVAARQVRITGPVTSLAARRSHKLLVAASLAGAALVGSAGVAAAAGSLPDPIQRIVASAIEPVGIHVPVPQDPPATPAPKPEGSTHATTGPDKPSGPRSESTVSGNNVAGSGTGTSSHDPSGAKAPVSNAGPTGNGGISTGGSPGSGTAPAYEPSHDPAPGG